MTWEYNNYLAHHGVEGQKWGVKHGPPYPINNSGYLASRIRKNAEKTEPKITNDVKKSVEDSGCYMYGLNHRLKTEESLRRKINTDSKEKGMTVSETAGQIKDAIRYTSVANDDSFTDSYYSIRDSLSQKGYTEVQCKNYFDLYRAGKANHKQLTCVYKDRDGNRFELQFHTESSIKAKERKTPLYEEARSPGTGQKRKEELKKEMNVLMDKVPNPKGVYRIKSH